MTVHQHCIGWTADTPCTAWGYPSWMHGCIFYANHTGRCECRCGATTHKPTTSHTRRL